VKNDMINLDFATRSRLKQSLESTRVYFWHWTIGADRCQWT